MPTADDKEELIMAYYIGYGNRGVLPSYARLIATRFEKGMFRAVEVWPCGNASHPVHYNMHDTRSTFDMVHPQDGLIRLECLPSELEAALIEFFVSERGGVQAISNSSRVFVPFVRQYDKHQHQD